MNIYNKFIAWSYDQTTFVRLLVWGFIYYNIYWAVRVLVWWFSNV